MLEAVRGYGNQTQNARFEKYITYYDNETGSTKYWRLVTVTRRYGHEKVQFWTGIR